MEIDPVNNVYRNVKDQPLAAHFISRFPSKTALHLNMSLITWRYKLIRLTVSVGKKIVKRKQNLPLLMIRYQSLQRYTRCLFSDGQERKFCCFKTLLLFLNNGLMTVISIYILMLLLQVYSKKSKSSAERQLRRF